MAASGNDDGCHEILLEYSADHHLPILASFKHCRQNDDQAGFRGEESGEDGEINGGANFVRTCFNGLNALSGVGLLSIPYALSEGGWLSLSLLVLVAAICWYTGILLQRCMEADRAVRGYPDVGNLAFGVNGRLLVSTLMYLELYLVAVGFLILEGDNLDKLFPNAAISVGPLNLAGKQLFIVLSAMAILPTMLLRSLSLLAYISASGVFASVVVVICVFWAAAVDHVGFHGKGRFLNIGGIPSALGLYTFCYCGHAIFPTLHGSMKDKSKFSKVLVTCFSLCTINYGSMAILGYLMYGEGVQSQVTLNLPHGKLSSKLAILTTLINPFAKYNLMVTPIAAAIEERILISWKRSGTMLIRALLLLSTLIIALLVPFFGDLMTLVGSLLSISMSMLLPCICYLKIFKVSRCCKVDVAACVGIAVVGSLVAASGTVTALQQIICKVGN